MSFSVTISKHFNYKNDHLDLFFDRGEKFLLKTYEANLQDWKILKNGGIISLKKKNDHRREYLDFSGIIQSNKGEIEVLWRGSYQSIDQLKKENLKVRISGNELIIIG